MTTGPTEPAAPEQPPADDIPAQSAGASLPASKSPTEMGVWMVAGIASVCALVVMTVGILGYMKFFDVGTRIGVVDIGNIMETKQVQLASMVFNNKATDKERGDAYDDAQRFGDRLHEALKAAEDECKCLLLTSAAVVQGTPVDMTFRVKEMVGLSHIDIEATKRQIQNNMQAAPEQGRQ